MVDYSKWKDIEISDDEDDTHPNIDTPSLFRWRHQARVDRMEEKNKEKEETENERKRYDERLKLAKKALEEAEKYTDEEEKAKRKRQAQKQMSDIQSELKKINIKAQEIEKKEKMEPWNVDTISQAGFDKSIINKDQKRPKEMSEDEKAEDMRVFVKENEDLIKQFGMFRIHNDSMKFMQEHSHLACENTANYLVLWCINLELEQKNTLMRHVAHQAICLQFILELAKQLDRDPRSCISAFFHRIQQAEVEYKRVFDDELKAFIDRIEKRAKEKIRIAQEEAEEEERQARLGPGGLDPLEVIETLPKELRECFESQDISQMQSVIANMNPKDASYHMKRCVDSGLWVPQGGDAATDPSTGLLDKDKDKEEEDEEEEEEKKKEEPIYEKIEDSVD